MGHIIKCKDCLIIGDIHGEYDIFQKAVQYGKENNLVIIVVGDYIDSWKTNSPNSIVKQKIQRDQFKCLELARQLNEEGHYCIIGNHELSYLDNSMRCPGHQDKLAPAFLHKIKDANLKDYVIIKPSFGDDILVTHAGLSNKFANQVWGSLSNLKHKLDQQLDSYRNAIYDRGGARYLDIGVRRIYSGIFWCRPYEFEPLEAHRQVFGHTNTHTSLINTNNIYVWEGRDSIKWRNINVDNLIDSKNALNELLVYRDLEDKFEIISKEQWLNN